MNANEADKLTDGSVILVNLHNCRVIKLGGRWYNEDGSLAWLVGKIYPGIEYTLCYTSQS